MDDSDSKEGQSPSFENFIVYTAYSIVNLVTLVIGLPVVSLALYVVYRQFKASHVANVYVINLLISDIIQFLGRPWIYLTPSGQYVSDFFWGTFLSGIVSSLGFMLCIAMERYLLIAHPHWYRSRFTLKLSAVTSLAVWLVSLIAPIGLIFLRYSFSSPPVYDASLQLIATLLLIPLPLLLFFFVGTWRGLSKTITLSSREKKRILATLLLVIVNYSFLFFPQIISYYQKPHDTVDWECIPLFFSPLLDPLLYIFIRKDTKHIMEEFPCCHRSPRDEEQTVSSIAV